MSDKAKLPIKATAGAVGYDLFSAEQKTIMPNTRKLIKTDITFVPPPGTYGQVVSRSGLALKYQTDAKAGVIDSDYRGNVAILLANSSDQPVEIGIGDRVAQLILYKISTPNVEQVQDLDSTERGDSGFGSTGIIEATVRELQGNKSTVAEPANVLDPVTSGAVAEDVHGAADIIIQEDAIKPYNFWLSNDPFDNRLIIPVDVKDQHPTLGMQFVPQKDGQRLQLQNISPSTPAAKILKWRSTLQWSYLIEIDGLKISNASDVERAIAKARKEQKFKALCVFATEKRYGTHPVKGSLNLYFDQMNSFSKTITHG